MRRLENLTILDVGWLLHHISETVQDMAIVIIVCYQEVACALSISNIINDIG